MEKTRVCLVCICKSIETSPRAWRKPCGTRRDKGFQRNISTCVEKTLLFRGLTTPPEKHLHVRGENTVRLTASRSVVETSPRAWRKRLPVIKLNSFVRNISTCVEKTETRYNGHRLLQKHLHVRGENFSMRAISSTFVETSPRAWRKLIRCSNLQELRRNISTCVEKTPQKVVCLHYICDI